MSAAYETDSVDPLVSAIGRFTFHADIRHAMPTSKKNKPGDGNARGPARNSTRTPSAMMIVT